MRRADFLDRLQMIFPGTSCNDGSTDARFWNQMENSSGIYFVDSRKLSLYEQNQEQAGERALQPAGVDNHTDIQLPALGGFVLQGWIASALEEVEKLQEVWLIRPDEAYGQWKNPLGTGVFVQGGWLRARSHMAEKKVHEKRIDQAWRFCNIPLYISIVRMCSVRRNATTWSQRRYDFRRDVESTSGICALILKKRMEKSCRWISAGDI